MGGGNTQKESKKYSKCNWKLVAHHVERIHHYIQLKLIP